MPLRGIPRILPPPLLTILAEMGHGDEIVLADANFPGVSSAEKGRVVHMQGMTDTWDSQQQQTDTDVQQHRAATVSIHTWYTLHVHHVINVILQAHLVPIRCAPSHNSCHWINMCNNRYGAHVHVYVHVHVHVHAHVATCAL